METKDLKTAVENIKTYLTESRNPITISAKILRSIKENYEKLIKLREKEIPPCNVGDKVAVRALCECVYTTPNNDECRYECPFEDDCEYGECDNSNERIFVTTIGSIFNEGYGWQFTFKDLNIEARESDIGVSFFMGENAEQQALEFDKALRGVK